MPVLQEKLKRREASAGRCPKCRTLSEVPDVVRRDAKRLSDVVRLENGIKSRGFDIGFRPFHLSQLAPTCGPAAVLRRASLHDEDVQLRSQIPQLAPPRARIAHRSGSGSRHSAE